MKSIAMLATVTLVPCAGVLTAQSAHAQSCSQVLLQDDFEDGVLDPEKWFVVLPPVAGASVTEQGGECVIKNRGYLVSQAEMEPIGPQRLVVTGTWRFHQLLGDYDAVRIITRGEPTPDQTPFNENTGGFWFSFSTQGDPTSVWINGWGDGNEVKDHVVTGAMTFQVGVDYAFEVVDSNSEMSFTVWEEADPFNWQRVTATFVECSTKSKNFLAYNREPIFGNKIGSFGELRLELVEGSTTTYCSPAGANSASATGAKFTVTGCPGQTVNNLVFSVEDLPPNMPGIFFYGSLQAQIPFGSGLLCVGGSTERILPAQFASSLGTVSLPIDLTVPPFSGGSNAIHPGSTWNFQFWYRDPKGGQPGFNLSDAKQILFAP